MNVIIVGNGPSALDKKLGSIIDSADIVVRLNNFQTKGYEEFVGSKTDILFTCRLNEYLDNLHEFPEVILYLLMNPLDGVTIPEELLRSSNISTVITWEDINTLNPLLKLKDNCYPSTGCTAILHMIKRFGHVNILGFDNFINGQQHYYELGKEGMPSRHDGEGEKRIIKLFKTLSLIN